MLFVMSAMCCGAAQAQSLWQLEAELDAKLETSRKTLRDAIVQLREVRSRSCTLGNATDCDLVTLGDVELVLLDLETKYWRASRTTSAPPAAEKYKKAKDAADEARGKVSELIDILK